MKESLVQIKYNLALVQGIFSLVTLEERVLKGLQFSYPKLVWVSCHFKGDEFLVLASLNGRYAVLGIFLLESDLSTSQEKTLWAIDKLFKVSFHGFSLGFSYIKDDYSVLSLTLGIRSESHTED
jgi:hypothetical protein